MVGFKIDLEDDHDLKLRELTDKILASSSVSHFERQNVLRKMIKNTRAYK